MGEATTTRAKPLILMMIIMINLPKFYELSRAVLLMFLPLPYNMHCTQDK